MPITPTPLKDAFVFEPSVFEDERGYFFESYNQDLFRKETGLDIIFVQDNQAQSSQNVLRGLHFQLGDHAQSKLIRSLAGSIWDVIVDLRMDSPSYGQWFGIELSAANKKQLFVPKGFGHGYSVLTPSAEVFYKCDAMYHKAAESGVLYKDSGLNIDWKIDVRDAIISEKDKEWNVFDPIVRLF